MKKLYTLLLACGLFMGAGGQAEAVEFKVRGDWMFGFSAIDSSFVKNPGTKKSGAGGQDVFDARQRVRLRLEAVASETLSGVVYFEIGDTNWGRASKGGALGADGTIVEIKHAYLDWLVPSTELKLRMGLQYIEFPNAAGGSSLFADDAAGITASYRFNDNVSLTAVWGRLYNDNHVSGQYGYDDTSNYLDNMDMGMLSLPVTMDGWKITPFVAASFTGKNAMGGITNGYLGNSSNLYPKAGLTTAGFNTASLNKGGSAYSSAFWFGLPVVVTALEPWRFEFDFNYGYSEGFGRYNAYTADGGFRRADSRREGWLVKGLVEYKMDWGTPGIFGWYGSGDQGVGDGSGRMPSLDGWGTFTSFMGDNAYAWGMGSAGSRNSGYEIGSVYMGTWGIGAHIKDMSFVENLRHTFRIAYWRGTNAPEMTRYVRGSWDSSHSKGWDQIDESVIYLTTQDWLLEFNLDTTWKIYDNLEAMLELGYIVNGIDRDQWRKYGNGGNWQKADAYKAGVIFKYSF